MYKSLKRMISIILAVVLASFIAVTAFAAENETTDSKLLEAQETLYNKAKKYNTHYIDDDNMMGITSTPIWEMESLTCLYNEIHNVFDNVYDCTAIKDVETMDAALEKALSNLALEPDELRWLLSYMEKDINSTGYYDDETMVELQEVYNKAEAAYESGDNDSIYLNYLMLRNELNKLCSINQVYGDVNFDGELSVDDITLMQKHIAGLTEFNSSQCYLSSEYGKINIDYVTDWQKNIAGLDSSVDFGVKKNMLDLNENTFFEVNLSKYKFGYKAENGADLSNRVYTDDHRIYKIEKYDLVC